MTDETPTIRAVDKMINRLGGELMFHEAMSATAANAGIDTSEGATLLVLYVGGRGAVLGDAPAPVVRSAFCWFEPSMIETHWVRSTAFARSRAELAALYCDGLAEGARRRYATTPDAAAEVAELGRIVVDAVEPMGLALFSGWQAMPAPSDPLGACGVVLQCLRELRGDLHVQAVSLVGLAPHQTVLATAPKRIGQFGWSEPHPDPAPSDARDQAEDLTDVAMARAYDVLDATQQARFASAVAALVAGGS